MSASYRVRVRFVDTTYWDDGSRWTSQTFKFDKRKEAINFARTASARGCKVRGQGGELAVHPDERDVEVERVFTAQVRWSPPKESTE